MKQQQQISEGDEAYKVALAVKNQLEQRTGKIYDFYNPVAVSTQVSECSKITKTNKIPGRCRNQLLPQNRCRQ